jgi:beta-ureidopropionase
MGTRARIATICQANTFYGSVEQNRAHVMRTLDLALAQKPDLVCLPETFTTVSIAAGDGQSLAESVPGPTTDMVAEKARAHRCYVICPIKTMRDDKCWNSAIIIDRTGAIAGIYDKIHPVTSSHDYTVFENGITPRLELPVFDLDFGRVGIQICFDIGFPESWEELAQEGARMVFWPSAYNGGFPLQVYAYLHHYYVVSAVRTDKSRIVDPCGVVLAMTDELTNVIYRDINLDYIVSHYDFDASIPHQIMAAYGDRVEVRTHRDDAHFYVEPTDDSVTIAQLQREFGFESTAQYHQRHKTAYQAIWAGQDPGPQVAAHGTRSPWGKRSELD